MTAVIQVNEQYAQKFNEMIKTFPPQAIKLTLVKNNLNDEINKRINEIKSKSISTKPIEDLSKLRNKYASDRNNSTI